MDTTDTKIKFNNDGVCDHCQTFYAEIKPRWDTGEKGHNKLLKIVKKIKMIENCINSIKLSKCYTEMGA